MSFDISISSDNMVASINYLAITNKDADIISFSFILSQLTQRKITYGIATEAIKKAVDEYQNDQKEIKNLVVSQGTLPIHGENGQIKCNFNSSLNDPEEYLKNQNLEQLTSYGENLVKTNQEIVEELEPTPGKDGCDIFGKILPARSGKKVSFDFDFTVDKRGNKFYANITGIA